MNKPEKIDNALISVILPVHNGEKLLAEAIGSVLEQNYQPLEIIIVDDGSTDSTARIISGFKGDIHYYYQSRSGPAAARNFGIRKSKGEFIAFIDCDDLWPNGKLIHQMNCFKAFPGFAIIQGLILRIIMNQVIDREKEGTIDYPFIYSNLGSMIMRRAVFEKIGFFDEGLNYHEDTDFWLRAQEAGLPMLVQRKVALIYRIHGRNMTSGKNIITTGFLTILRRSILRRRKEAGCAKEISPLKFIPDLLVVDKYSYRKQNEFTKHWPLVSIILYAINESVKIDQAVDSIRIQDYLPVEIFLVNSVIDPVPGFNLDAQDQVHHVNGYSNLASGLNAALQRVKGEVIAFLDAESAWAPGKLKNQIGYLLDHPTDGSVVGRTRNILMPDVRYPPELINEFALRKSVGDLLSTLIVRRSVMEQVGGFRSELAGMEETDWLLRARDMGFPQKMLPEVCLYRFVQPDFHIVGLDQMKSALLESVRSSVHRKRNIH